MEKERVVILVSLLYLRLKIAKLCFFLFSLFRLIVAINIHLKGCATAKALIQPQQLVTSPRKMFYKRPSGLAPQVHNSVAGYSLVLLEMYGHMLSHCLREIKREFVLWQGHSGTIAVDQKHNHSTLMSGCLVLSSGKLRTSEHCLPTL